MRDARKSNHRQPSRSRRPARAWSCCHGRRRIVARVGAGRWPTSKSQRHPVAPFYPCDHHPSPRGSIGASLSDRCLFVVVMQALRRSVLLRRIAPCRKRAGQRSRPNDLDRARAQYAPHSISPKCQRTNATGSLTTTTRSSSPPGYSRRFRRPPSQSRASSDWRAPRAWGSRTERAPDVEASVHGPGGESPMPTEPRRDAHARVSARPTSFPIAAAPA